MTLFRGTTPITSVYRGATPITSIYRGTTLLWTTSGAFADGFDDFPDNLDTLVDTGRWADEGPSTDYVLGINNGTARVMVPDGLLGGFFSLKTSRMLYTVGILGQDDVYSECRVATKGDAASLTSSAGYVTQMFHRGSNGAVTHGVGLEMRGGHFWITRRVAGTETKMADIGTFVSGDRLGLLSAGNLHVAYRNGEPINGWTDSGATASKGSGFRSLWIRGDGAKDLLGPRRFSPALDSVTMRSDM